jgi:OmpA-OmpF porin, OOP family
MRHNGIAAAAALLAAASLVPASGWAQANPSPEQILKSLTPTNTNSTTRGIRMGPAAGGASGAKSSQTEAAPSVSLTVQFATGSADLTPAATRVLDDLGKAISDKTLSVYHFRVEGHTDTVGTDQLNKDLSERRAAAVVSYLVTNYHLDPSRLQAVGMGKAALLVPTPDQTNEPRNRRVQVVNIGS